MRVYLEILFLIAFIAGVIYFAPPAIRGTLDLFDEVVARIDHAI